ncbi:MAG: NAD(P)-dependent alcohol dehydrogenase [Burkholderiaceae bacterium]|jgi:NADPH:quinone reductase-like Zn-dependent oxidoreductase|nr:NAD(P)-dependent alcohol dehydrogenase [Burkholderiaceae bacterium]
MLMKAVTHSRYGNPEVLQVTMIERPVPQKNEVLIRVKAAGLDYGQWHLMAGKPYAVRLATGPTKPKQRVLGVDVSGVVEAVGAEVTRFKVGDAVFGASSRTFAEFTCARQDQLCRMPERLSFEQAAASAVSGVTALIGLRDVARVLPGQSLCVIGAGGGVGSWAVQLARHFGAHVTAVCSTSKVEFVRSLGVASVIDYTKAPLPSDGRFDVILDLAGNRPLSVLRKALATRGTLVLGGGEGGDRFFGGMGRMLRAALWSMFLKQRLAMLVGLVKPEPLQALADILGQPSVTPAVDGSFPLEKAADAMRALVSSQVHGKLVLRVAA